jgi:hypothetical protein
LAIILSHPVHPSILFIRVKGVGIARIRARESSPSEPGYTDGQVTRMGRIDGWSG